MIPSTNQTIYQSRNATRVELVLTRKVNGGHALAARQQQQHARLHACKAAQRRRSLSDELPNRHVGPTHQMNEAMWHIGVAFSCIYQLHVTPRRQYSRSLDQCPVTFWSGPFGRLTSQIAPIERIISTVASA